MAEPIYEDDTVYAVSFTKVVTRGAFKYLPRHNPVMKGSALNDIVREYGADVVRTAEPR